MPFLSTSTSTSSLSTYSDTSSSDYGDCGGRRTHYHCPRCQSRQPIYKTALPLSRNNIPIFPISGLRSTFAPPPMPKSTSVIRERRASSKRYVSSLPLAQYHVPSPPLIQARNVVVQYPRVSTIEDTAARPYRPKLENLQQKVRLLNESGSVSTSMHEVEALKSGALLPDRSPRLADRVEVFVASNVSGGGSSIVPTLWRQPMATFVEASGKAPHQRASTMLQTKQMSHATLPQLTNHQPLTLRGSQSPRMMRPSPLGPRFQSGAAQIVERPTSVNLELPSASLTSHVSVSTPLNSAHLIPSPPVSKFVSSKSVSQGDWSPQGSTSRVCEEISRSLKREGLWNPMQIEHTESRVPVSDQTLLILGKSVSQRGPY